MGARSGSSGSGFGSKSKGGSGSGLQRLLSAHESAIRGNDYETLIALDENGNLLFSKKGSRTSVAYGADASKTTNAIVTHNHPDGGSFSWQDMHGMVALNQKEMRATTKDFTYSMKRPEKGWGTDAMKVKRKFQAANNAARRAYRKQRTGNAKSDAALWEKLTSDYNAKAAKSFGWEYSVKKNK